MKARASTPGSLDRHRWECERHRPTLTTGALHRERQARAEMGPESPRFDVAPHPRGCVRLRSRWFDPLLPSLPAPTAGILSSKSVSHLRPRLVCRQNKKDGCSFRLACPLRDVEPFALVSSAFPPAGWRRVVGVCCMGPCGYDADSLPCFGCSSVGRACTRSFAWSVCCVSASGAISLERRTCTIWVLRTARSRPKSGRSTIEAAWIEVRGGSSVCLPRSRQHRRLSAFSARSRLHTVVHCAQFTRSVCRARSTASVDEGR